MKSFLNKTNLFKLPTEKRNEYIWLALGIIGVFIIAIWKLPDNCALRIWGDEFGYWLSAAYLTGRDWSSAASAIPYYGYGYGVLLAPIMQLFGHNSVLMLQVALGLEAIMLATCVAASYLCIGYFNNQIHGIFRVILAVTSVLYPSNVLNVNITWAEILLVTLMWWYTYIVLRFIQEEKFSLAIIIIIMSVYMYTVHQRTIAVMIISLGLVIWVYRKNLKNPKLLIVMGVFISAFIVAFVFKKIYIGYSYVGVSEEVLQHNNLAGQKQTIINILTSLDGFRNLIISLIGKFYYISVASCMLVPLGVVKCFQVLIDVLRNKQNFKYMMGLLVVGLNFVASYLICAIAVSEDFVSRTDFLVYGRYIEHSIGPMIVLGIILLFEQVNAKILLATISAVCMSAFVAANNIGYRASHSNLWANCSAIADLVEGDRYFNGEELFQALVRGCIVLLILYFFSNLGKQLRSVVLNIVLICICVFWVHTGMTVRDNQDWWMNAVYNNQTEMLAYIDEDEFGLYQASMEGFFQFLRVDAKVTYYNESEEIDNLPASTYIITAADSDAAEDIRREQNIIVENKRYILWRTSKKEREN